MSPAIMWFVILVSVTVLQFYGLVSGRVPVHKFYDQSGWLYRAERPFAYWLCMGMGTLGWLLCLATLIKQL